MSVGRFVGMWKKKETKLWELSVWLRSHCLYEKKHFQHQLELPFSQYVCVSGFPMLACVASHRTAEPSCLDGYMLIPLHELQRLGPPPPSQIPDARFEAPVHVPREEMGGWGRDSGFLSGIKNKSIYVINMHFDEDA